MGATRLASGMKAKILIAETFPDAIRVAPISACVFLQRASGNLKCNKNGRAFDADFEHPTCKGKSITVCFEPLPYSNITFHHYQVPRQRGDCQK